MRGLVVIRTAWTWQPESSLNTLPGNCRSAKSSLRPSLWT